MINLKFNPQLDYTCCRTAKYCNARAIYSSIWHPIRNPLEISTAESTVTMNDQASSPNSVEKGKGYKE